MNFSFHGLFFCGVLCSHRMQCEAAAAITGLFLRTRTHTIDTQTHTPTHSHTHSAVTQLLKENGATAAAQSFSGRTTHNTRGHAQNTPTHVHTHTHTHTSHT